MTGNLVSIKSERLSATIDPFGAQLFTLRDGGQNDLLWNGDPAIWSGRAPILFPIVGELAHGQYRLDGKIFSLPRHGFARTRLFNVAAATPSSALFRLTWDDETIQAYPFHFALELSFALNASTLTIAAAVKNLGDTAMPASFGFHPALRWPLPYGRPRADHALVFAQDEPAPVRRLNGDGLVLPQRFPTPVIGRSLPLRDDLFAQDALIFDGLASRRLRYGAPDGPQITVAFPDTLYLGVWTKPGANFLCIEPWHGFADPKGYAGDFRDKPGIFHVPPGGAKECRMTISLD